MASDLENLEYVGLGPDEERSQLNPDNTEHKDSDYSFYAMFVSH